MRRTNAKELNVAEHAMRWCDRNEANSTIGLTGFDWSRRERDWLASPLIGFCVLWLKAPIQYYMPGALGNWKSVYFLALLITHHHSLTRVESRLEEISSREARIEHVCCWAGGRTRTRTRAFTLYGQRVPLHSDPISCSPYRLEGKATHTVMLQLHLRVRLISILHSVARNKMVTDIKIRTLLDELYLFIKIG